MGANESVTNQQEDQISEFIFEFLYKQKKESIAEIIRTQFRNGYCWHFANILRDTFHRGEIVWTAPLGHMVWYDPYTDKYYDIEGEYLQSKHDVFYMIPSRYLGEHIREFMHIPNDGHIEKVSKVSDLIEIVKTYCNDNNILYSNKIEEYFVR